VGLLSFFKRKPAEPLLKERRPRRCLPTYATKEKIILSKAAGHLRRSHEIDLAQALAVSKGLKLTLAIRPAAQMEPALTAQIRQLGVEVTEARIDDYSVYFGCTRRDGSDQDGWVLGNSKSFTLLTQTIRSLWLKDRMRIGATFAGEALAELETAVRKDDFRLTNVDGEDAREALLALIATARQDAGIVFIQ
jgi:hypothetical protein